MTSIYSPTAFNLMKLSQYNEKKMTKAWNFQQNSNFSGQSAVMLRTEASVNME